MFALNAAAEQQRINAKKVDIIALRCCEARLE